MPLRQAPSRLSTFSRFFVWKRQIEEKYPKKRPKIWQGLLVEAVHETKTQRNLYRFSLSYDRKAMWNSIYDVWTVNPPPQRTYTLTKKLNLNCKVFLVRKIRELWPFSSRRKPSSNTKPNQKNYLFKLTKLTTIGVFSNTTSLTATHRSTTKFHATMPASRTNAVYGFTAVHVWFT